MLPKANSCPYITIDVNELLISLYPNPAHSYFVLSNYANINTGNASIVVKDIAGRIYLTQKLTNATAQKVNSASLSTGTYMVSIITHNGVQT